MTFFFSNRLHNIKWRGHESQYKYRRGQRAHGLSPEVHRHVPVRNGRMPHPDDSYKERPQEPPRPGDYAEEDENGHHEDGKEPVPRPYEGVDYVPAVKLPHGQKVHGRHEDPYPAGEGHGMEIHVVPFGHRAYHGIGE